MTKRNIKLGLIAAFLVGVTFALSGCGKSEEQKNTQENQEQTQEQAPSQEQDQAQNQNRENKRMMTAPREGIEACADKAEGDACEVLKQRRETSENKEEKITGACGKIGNRDDLFCLSAEQNGPGGEGMKRPIGAPAGSQAEVQAEAEASK